MHCKCTKVGQYFYTESALNETYESSTMTDDYKMGSVCLAFWTATNSISPPLQFFCGYSILARYVEGIYLAKNVQSSFEPKMAFVVSKLLFNVSTPAKLSV